MQVMGSTPYGSEHYLPYNYAPQTSIRLHCYEGIKLYPHEE